MDWGILYVNVFILIRYVKINWIKDVNRLKSFSYFQKLRFDPEKSKSRKIQLGTE